jgi:AcrR family transcriptional regulator
MLTLRERKKRDKAQRIKEAARRVFREKGYHEATMREVAKAAGVATGTLFLYAADKRDLLILSVNEDLDRLTEEGAANTNADVSFLQQLIDLFRPRYEYWAIDRRLGLNVLQEVQETQTIDGAPGSGMVHYQRHREAIMQHIARLVDEHQRNGSLAAGESPETVAALIMLIYSTAVRYWLRGPKASVEDGVAVLREYLRIALTGMTPSHLRNNFSILGSKEAAL